NWYDKTQDAARRLTVNPAPAPSTQSTSTTSPSTSSSSSNFNMSFSWVSVLGWIGISVLLGILAWLLIRVFLMREQRLAQHSHTDLVTTGTDADRVENLPIPVRRPAGDLLSEARMHYENGNYRDAIIYLYSHQLVSLDKHQMIRLVRGKTNRQYLRDLVSRQPLRGLLEQTMLTFEDVFFGDLAITRERFETCWKRLPDFDALVQGARA
ncbi:MAG: hypothetical protein K8T25_17925, partial [Planctomycetia bacterium]|nr:hypothetical protein [Planctomycetia bacterium]